MRHSFNGFKNVSLDEYKKRLNICNACKFRSGKRCLKCGCYLSKKAWWKSEKCPIKKWM
jgi:hypothetical protein